MQNHFFIAVLIWSATSVCMADDLFFESGINRILESKCAGCHNRNDAEAGLDLTSGKAVIKGGKNGKIIFESQLETSPLLIQINSKSMPPQEADPLTPDEIRLINLWVKNGAKFKSKVVSSVTSERIIPLLHLRCVTCHGAAKKEAGLDLRSVESMLKGSKSGPVVVKGNSSKSLIVKKIISEEMPPRKRIVPDSVKTMTTAELAILRQWIDDGMKISSSSDDARHTRDSELKFWSLQPPARLKPLTVKGQRDFYHPVDQFLHASLKAGGLSFSPESGKRTLIRRVYFDLIGLPPRKSEIDLFLQDDCPDAYEKLVDRLILSPEFAEKWAADWLDVVGYADSEGGQNEDRVRSEIWRYRDYVVESFSHDKSYRQFLIEQLAGDELYDYENDELRITEPVYEALVATGFLRTTPDRTFQDITNFVPDRLDVIADELQVVGSALMGMTIHCARCHAHKFDPIPQQDYYRLSAIFKGALDEHDWLKPENRILEIPVARLGHGIPNYVVKSAHEEKIRLRALWSRGRPSPSFLLLRGNPETPGREVQPKVPEFAAATGMTFQIEAVQHQTKKSGRRLAFAHWMTDRRNPLTARVYVNRIWNSIFGKGIVRSLDNFGKTGAPPSHPELLDWLAVEFMENDWSTKHLIRSLVTSRAYRQSSRIDEQRQLLDPENLLVSRMPLKRLSAESVRDSILRVTHQLSSKKSGPPSPVEEKGNGLVVSQQLQSGGWSRSIYVLHRRSKIPTLMENFDYPQMGPNCIVRKNSIVPQQALHLTNNALVQKWCESWAIWLLDRFEGNREKMLFCMLESATGSSPSNVELQEWKTLLGQQEQIWRLRLGKDAADREPFKKAVETVCHTVINSAAFLYVD